MMNLQNFQLLKEDQDHYVVGHPQGREIKIQKKGLSKKALEKISGMKKYAEGGQVQPSQENSIQPEQVPYYLQPNEVATGRDAAAKYFQNDQSANLETPQNAENIISTQPVVGKNPAQNVAIPEQTQSQNNVYSPTQALVGSLEAQKSAIEDIGKAEADKAQAEREALSATADQIKALQTPKQIYDQFQAKDQQLQQAFMNKSIDPNRYYKNLDTSQKIGNAIALILGGIGAGLTGQQNPALNIIQTKINQDIQAQENDQSKAFNLWKMNREMLGDRVSATLATQNQLLTGVKVQMEQAAANANSPIAQARAQQSIAQIDQQIAQNRYQLSLTQGDKQQQSEGQFLGNDPTPLIQMRIPEGLQSKAYEEAKAAQALHQNYPQIVRAFDEAAKEQKVFSKNIVPGVESAARKRLRVLLGPTVQHLEGSVRDSLFKSLDENILPQVFDFESTIAQRRQALDEYMKSASHYPVLEGHGIYPSKFQSTSTPFVSQNKIVDAFMKNNPNLSEQQAVEILTKNGLLK